MQRRDNGPDFLAAWDIHTNLEAAFLAPVRAAIGAFLAARPEIADDIAGDEAAFLRVRKHRAKAGKNLADHRRRPAICA